MAILNFIFKTYEEKNYFFIYNIILSTNLAG